MIKAKLAVKNQHATRPRSPFTAISPFPRIDDDNLHQFRRQGDALDGLRSLTAGSIKDFESLGPDADIQVGKGGSREAAFALAITDWSKGQDLRAGSLAPRRPEVPTEPSATLLAAQPASLLQGARQVPTAR